MGIKGLGNQANTFGNKFVKALGGDSTGEDAVLPKPPFVGTVEASGGIINEYTEGSFVYRSHTFTTTGTLEITDITGDTDVAEFFLVAGGGGGGNSSANGHGGNGGGGGGGFVEGDSMPIAVGETYTVTVGAGGQSVTYGPGSSGPSRNGTNTTISNPNITTITAKGGGGGGNDYDDTVGGGSAVGSGGGSWGGGGAPSPGAAGQPGTNSLYGATDYGNAGGGTGPVSPAYCAGGGGGAGGSGETTPGPNQGGRGGNGRSSIFAYGPTQPVIYAGGGGGGATPYGGSNGGGPPNGGGGKGAGNSAGYAQSGDQFTGGGGGGMGNPTGSGSLHHGGSGIAVIRYKIGQVSATAKATGGLISHYNGKIIHTFFATGPFSTNQTITGAEFFLVGGGASGAAEHGGGGGAGGCVYHPNFTFPQANHTITIGAGGYSISTTPGNDGGWPLGVCGNATSLSHGGYSANGGGHGGGWPNRGAASGGSGGGASGGPGNSTGWGPGANPASNPGAIEYGNPGGTGNDGSGYAGGGGGGAGGTGGAGNNGKGGTGGIGMQLPATFRDPNSVVGTPGPGGNRFYVAGGGGGCGHGPGTSYGNAPDAGGGGRGGIDPEHSPPACAGQANTGSGGGGGGNNTLSRKIPANGAGGSGIALIAYPA